jgi:glutathione S-transferase
MKLYGFPPSPNTCKVRAVAAHLNLPLDMDVIDIMKGEGAPGFLKLNPNGRTPVLYRDFTLWESNAIMQYVADKQPNSLWPQGASAPCRWQFWQAYSTKAGPVPVENLLKKILGWATLIPRP